MLLSFHLTNPKGFISEPKCVCSLRCSTHLRHLLFRLQKGAIGTCCCCCSCCCCLFSVSLILLVPFALTVHLTQTLCVFTGEIYAQHIHTECDVHASTEAIWIPSEFWFLNAIYRCRCSSVRERKNRREKNYSKREIELNDERNKNAGIFHFCYYA